MKRKIINGLFALALVLSFSLVTVTPSLAAPSSDATLSNLIISSGTLTPAFASGTISYTDSVAHNMASITVTPTVHESHATVTVNGTTVASGSASGAITLSVGANPITVVITAQDTTTKTYTVTVTGAGPSPVALGQASAFAVLAGTGITNTGTTTISGDVGTYPTTTEAGFGTVTLTGTNHGGDAITQQAKTDLTTAYTDAAARTPVTTVATELGGTTQAPGIYNSAAGTFGITGTLTLNGDANAVWIFEMASTLITASSSQVSLINGAKAANVYWVVGSSATLGGVGGTSSHFEGNILAHASITLNTGVVMVGRALAQVAVTLNTNTIVAAPTISSFTPTSGGTGTSVVITGTNLTGASAVAFGVTAAASFVVNSATQITAVVGSGTTGTVSATTPGGTATSAGTFTYVAVPTISSFTPTSGGSGTSVTITGTNLTGATAVTFGGTAATSVSPIDASHITAVVGSGTTSIISVVTPGGTATSSGTFTFVAAPTVASISPVSGPIGGGTAVTITGTGFYGGGSLSAVSAVSFGAAATFTVSSDTSISATTPAGSAGAVNVVVTTPGGTGTLTNGYTFVAATFTLTPPSSFIWTSNTNTGALVLGANTGSATAGSVVTNVAGWHLTSVSDIKTTTNGHMTIGGADTASLALADPMQAGMTNGTFTTIPLYQGQLTSATGYGATGTFSIPLYANQTVVGTDAAGSYRITLTYTATAGP